MGISGIIKAIKEYQEVRKTSDSSGEYNFPLQQARRQVETAIVELIDSRIKSYMAREKRKSSQALAFVESTLTSKEVNMLDALNSAPTPPKNKTRWLASSEPLAWMEAYESWFNSKRAKAIK